MNRFRKLTVVALSSGAIAGLALFALQHFSVVPLIHAAETYEASAQRVLSDAPPENEDWQPANGWQRTSLTALATVLSGVGLAAILLGSMALAGKPVNARRGALWGLAAFVCFHLNPALGLPPQPPGVAVADLYERQLWWAGTAIWTAIGLCWLAAHGLAWLHRIGGAVCVLLPHLIGAPISTGHSTVPAQLVLRFAITSLATTCVFWLLVGTIGGFLYNRHGADQRLKLVHNLPRQHSWDRTTEEALYGAVCHRRIKKILSRRNVLPWPRRV